MNFNDSIRNIIQWYLKNKSFLAWKYLNIVNSGYIKSNLVNMLINKVFFIYELDNLISDSFKSLFNLNAYKIFVIIDQELINYIYIKKKLIMYFILYN